MSHRDARLQHGGALDSTPDVKVVFMRLQPWDMDTHRGWTGTAVTWFRLFRSSSYRVNKLFVLELTHWWGRPHPWILNTIYFFTLISMLTPESRILFNTHLKSKMMRFEVTINWNLMNIISHRENFNVHNYCFFLYAYQVRVYLRPAPVPHRRVKTPNPAQPKGVGSLTLVI